MIKNSTLWRFLSCQVLIFAITSLNVLSAQTGPNDDFDGDGIINSVDIDDDNDGVPDAVESPNCFYSASEWNTGIKPITNGVTVTSALTTTLSNFGQLLDNVPATTAVTFTAGQAIQNANVYLFTFAQPVRLDALYLKFNTASQFANTTKIQGSNTNNGSDWVDLSAAVSQTPGSYITANGLVEVTNSIKYPVSLNASTAYKYIRITGVVASNIAAQNSSEVYFDFNVTNYVASYYPKAACSDANIDGDGVLPHFDLDSDGDGCSDAYEAGATTSLATNYKFTGAVGVNGLDNTLETSDNGIVNYTSTYYVYAQNSAMQVCKDTDGDGILDINDIDDDNDGVLDTAEQVLETCSGVFNIDSRVVWNPTFTNSNTTATGNATINGTPITVTATTTKVFNALKDDHWHFGSGTYVGCPDVTTVVSNSVINVFSNDYTVTYTFSRPVRNPSLSFSSFNGTAVLFPHPVYVSGLQGTVSGVSTNSYITTFPATENTVAVIYNGVFNSISFRVEGADAQGSVLLNIPYVLDAGSLTYTLTSGSPFGYLDIDTDGDGIVNRLDLDSDGDGCPDAREAGVSINAGASASMSASGGSIYTGGIPSGTANAYVGNGTPSQYSANGFFNGIETSLESGVYNGTYTYAFATSGAINLCVDTDGDGVGDFIDIDDDNDGVVDAVESPACFYTANEWNTDAKPFYGVTISSALTTTTGNFSQLIDGVSGTTAVAFSASPTQAIQNANAYLFNFAQPIRLDALYLQFNTTTQFGGTTKIQGSNTNNGSDWVDLSAAIAQTAGTNVTTNGAVSVTTSIKYPVTLNTTTAYKYIRITGVAASNIVVANASEVYFDFNNTAYVASSYPKAITCSNDPDNDTIPNHLDLDSDGDGCPDAREAGVSSNVGASGSMSTSGGTLYTGGIPSGTANAYVGNGTPAQYGTNGFFNGIETVVDNGLYNSTYTYQYANSNTLNACLDTDGDGVGDLIDIDDDNDGVLDTLEQNCPNGSKTGVIVTKPAAITYTFSGAQTLTHLVDGIDSNILVMHNPTPPAALSNAEWFRVEFPYARILSSWEVGHYVNQTLFSTTSTYKVQGSNDASVWTDLTGTLTYSNTQNGQSTQANNSNVANFPSNVTAYKYYRYFGISGTVGTGWATEFYFKDGGCVDIDTDGDGIPNRLDLDSDGDGCPDARESGVSNNAGASGSMSASGGSIYTGGIPSGTANAYVGNGTSSQYGANGFFNGVETTADNGVYNGSYTYPFAVSTAYNLCIDTDGDGIGDLIDIDDDNDGVVDSVESPTCFYTANEWNTTVKPFYGVTISSGLTTTTGNFSQLIDGVNNVSAVTFSAVPTQPIQNANVYLFNFAHPVKLDALYLQFNTVPQFGNTTKIQGSNTNNGSDWVDLSATIATGATTNVTANGGVSVTTSIKYPVTLNTATAYKYIRITGVAASNIVAANASEVYFDFNNASYVASQYPKATCAADTDGDGIVNHLDLDSDGDGCPDAREAGVSSNPGASVSMSASGGSIYTGGIPSGTPNAYVGNGSPAQYGVNGLFNDIETPGDSGNYNGTYTYQYANNSSLNACLDTDGDGVGDIIDIDDDNDGILDVMEQTCTTSNTVKTGIIVTKPSTINYTFDGAQTLANLVDGTDANDYIIYNPTGTLSNSEWLRVELPSAKVLTYWEIGQYSGQTLFATTSTYKVQGSNDASAWTDLTGTLTYSNTQTGQSTQSNSNIADFPSNLTAYKYYRYYGISATVGNGWATEFYFKERNCINIDTDGDGTPNHLDLDSDGDGCTDAVEAGVYEYINSNAGVMSKGSLSTNVLDPSGIINAIAGSGASADYGTNGYYNVLETAENGVAKYVSTYDMALDAAVSNCANADGDEVPDFVDIDDDNDGVLDHVEACSFRQYSVPGDIIDGTTTTVLSSVVSAGFTESPLSACAGTAIYDNQYPYTNPAACSFITRTGTQSSGTWKITFSSPIPAEKIMIGFGTSAAATTNVTYTYAVNPGADASLGTARNVEFSNIIAQGNLTKNGIATYNQTTVGAGMDASLTLKGFGNRTVKSLDFSIAGMVTTGSISFYVLIQSNNCDPDGDGIPNHLDNDSDNDGCSDAKEAGVIDYITANGGTYSSGILNNPSATPSAEAIAGNNTPSNYGRNGFYTGIESNDTPAATYLGAYTYANAINALIANCSVACYKPAITSGTVLDTKQGITSLKRAGSDNDNWPMVRKGAWTALESKTKGFVPNRLTITQINAIPAANLREGMMVYNINSDCLYINTDGTATGWKCFNTQTCP